MGERRKKGKIGSRKRTETTNGWEGERDFTGRAVTT